MHVVGHQAISVEKEGKFGLLALESAGELEVVIMGSKDLSAIIAASDDVIESAADFYPRLARHGGGESTDTRIKCQRSEA
jgi:hypothetical protein